MYQTAWRPMLLHWLYTLLVSPGLPSTHSISAGKKKASHNSTSIARRRGVMKATSRADHEYATRQAGQPTGRRQSTEFKYSRSSRVACDVMRDQCTAVVMIHQILRYWVGVRAPHKIKALWRSAVAVHTPNLSPPPPAPPWPPTPSITTFIATPPASIPYVKRYTQAYV